MGMKHCRRCDQTKPLTEYHRDSGATDGHTSYCKECQLKKSRQWYADNTERARASGRARWSGRSERGRNYLLQKKYGITLDDYRAMLDRQGGVCAICGGLDRTQDGRAMPVDHCHRTGKVRGILCSHCNRAVGLLGDDPEVITRAASYLRSGQSVVPVSTR